MRFQSCALEVAAHRAHPYGKGRPGSRSVGPASFRLHPNDSQLQVRSPRRDRPTLADQQLPIELKQPLTAMRLDAGATRAHLPHRTLLSFDDHQLAICRLNHRSLHVHGLG